VVPVEFIDQLEQDASAETMYAASEMLAIEDGAPLDS